MPFFTLIEPRAEQPFIPFKLSLNGKRKKRQKERKKERKEFKQKAKHHD